MPRVPTVIPEPMLARLSDRLPIGAAWSYEVKWDGYRCLALKVGDAVTLRSRNASNLTASYPAVAAALRTLSAHRALLDGEIVVLDGEGYPSFQGRRPDPYFGILLARPSYLADDGAGQSTAACTRCRCLFDAPYHSVSPCRRP